MYKSVVYKGNELQGEVEVYPQIPNEKNGEVKEIRISHFSQPSERCSPLAVLCTIATGGVRFRMESSCKPLSRDSLLFLLHSSCLKENKTAVMPLGEEELHLVAMHSSLNDNQWPCFWCFKVALGLYSSCLVMLNLRCLGIVFDLDETLIVANTLRSFEDRIDALQRRINAEVDPRRITGMLAEVKRYQDDKMILKQYAENDQVDDNGKVIKIQSEVVPAFSDSQQPIVRPIIRLHEKNIILTRINPLIRDTSVLVRLRPAWEDLRSYLTARGRKRFEVYVCTMAERDYALEMWRLLDPESNLINSKELLERIVCVKSGSKKSLHNVFQDGNCHPKMALVIDDRLKVWDEKDQPRVHVVPAFAPYYAPQAEANNAIPVLCVARNVACNVRGGFFKEFDEGLLQRISKVSYADDISDILSPDVSNYLVSEHFCNWDDSAASNVSKDPPISDGMADAEVERRLKEGLPAPSSIPLPINDRDPRLAHSVQSAVTSLSSSPPPPPPPPVHPDQYFLQVPSLGKSIVNVGPPDPSLQTSSAREEGEVPESELDPDTRRRLLILQHGQDTRDHASSEPSVPVGPPTQVSLSQVQSRGNWFPAEEEMSPRQLSRTASKEVSLDSEALLEKNRSYHSSFFHKSSSVRADRTLQENLRLPKEAFHRDVRFRSNNSSSSFNSFSGEEGAPSRSSFGNSNFDSEFRRSVPYAEAPARYLQGIAIKCGTKVEFKPALIDSMELKFSIEVWFSGEKIGEGIGRTRKEALHQASEASLLYLAQRYISHVKPDSSAINENLSLFDGLPNDGNALKRHRFSDDCTTFSTALESSRLLDHGLDGSRRSMGGSVSDLKELCMMEGLGVVFQGQPPISTSPMQKDEVYAQVEIDGQVLGKGVGLTWDEAKMQAAEKALGSLKSMLGQYSKKREVSPRWLHGMSSKRGRPEFSRVTQRVPSEKYPKNGASVP